MTDFQAARTNMVDCQIQTNGVIDADILSIFDTIPRENFLPKELQNVAYTDESIAMSKERFLLAPMTHARMVQALAIQPDNVALDIGGGYGYSAAILSALATTVIAVENKQTTIDKATKILDTIDIRNIAFVKGKLTEGHAKHAPYDAIFIGGALQALPENLIAQLCEGGRMTCILQTNEHSIGQAILITKGRGAHYSKRVLFETNSRFMTGFETEAEFVF